MQSNPEETISQENTAARLLAHAHGWWHADPGFSHHLAFGLAFGLLIATVCYIGVVPVREYAYDLVFFLDNGWRVFNGQRPHVDFSSPWGPVTFLVVASGLKLANGTAQGVAYGTALVGLFIGLWAYRLMLRRMGWAPAALAGIALTALCIAPRSLGLPIVATSYAMLYNRWGYALLSLVTLECFPSRRVEENRALDFSSGLSPGVAIAILLFLKVSYFLVSIGLLVFSLLLWRHTTRRRLVGLAIGAGVVSLTLLWYEHFAVHSILTDLQMAAHARSQALSPGALFMAPFSHLQEGFLLFSALALVVAFADTSLGARRRWRPVLLALVIYGAGLALLLTNAQESEFPLNATFGLILLSYLLSQEFPLSASYAATLSLFALLVFAPPIATDLATVGVGVWKAVRPPQADCSRVPVGGLVPLVMCESSNLNSIRANGRALAAYLTDGVDLLHQHLRKGETVTTFDYYNPFSFALARTPARGGVAAAHNYVFNDRFHPTADAYFGDADVVMFPKIPAPPPEAHARLVKIYGEALESRFRLAAESSRWRLYRRK